MGTDPACKRAGGETTRPLPDRIRTATERMREAQAAVLADWADLYVSLGRAAQAADMGDTAQARHWLREAETCEYGLIGNCDETGAVIEALDAEVSS